MLYVIRATPIKCGKQRFTQTIFTYLEKSGRRIVNGNTKKEVDLSDCLLKFPKSLDGLGCNKEIL